MPGCTGLSCNKCNNATRCSLWTRSCPPSSRGGDTADPGETIALATMCQQPTKKRDAAAARLYADAFAAEPKLAADLQQQHRYNAACSAALAAAGEGEDAACCPTRPSACSAAGHSIGCAMTYRPTRSSPTERSRRGTDHPASGALAAIRLASLRADPHARPAAEERACRLAGAVA